jgi:hypothetical protein
MRNLLIPRLISRSWEVTLVPRDGNEAAQLPVKCINQSGMMEEAPHGELAEWAWVVGLKGHELL